MTGKSYLTTLLKNCLTIVRARNLQPGCYGTGSTDLHSPKSQMPGLPVIDLCRSQKNGHQLNYPQKTPAKSRPHFQIAAGIIFHKNKILIARRLENGLLGGLWEFPGGKQEKDETLEQTVVREVKEETGIRVRVDFIINHCQPSIQPFYNNAACISMPLYFR